MTARTDAMKLREIVEDTARGVVRASVPQEVRRTVTAVQGPDVAGQGGTCTVEDSQGNASFGVRWYEHRPKVGDNVLISVPPPGGTRRILAINRELADGGSSASATAATASTIASRASGAAVAPALVAPAAVIDDPDGLQVDVLPELPDDTLYPAGTVIALKADNSLYESTGSGWVRKVEGPAGGGTSGLWKRRLYNGDFALPPPDPSQLLNNDTNKLPGWAVVDNSGGVCTAQWQADAGSGSGGSILLTLGAGGAAPDDIYLEAVGDARASRSQNNAYMLIASWVRVTNDANPLAYVAGQPVTSDHVTTTGSPITGSNNFANLDAAPDVAAPGLVTDVDQVLPSDCDGIRVRVGAQRSTGLIGTSYQVTLSEVTLVDADPWTIWPDILDPTLPPFGSSNQGGRLAFVHGNDVELQIDGVNGILDAFSDVAVSGDLTVGGVAVSLAGHGAADHADITRFSSLVADAARSESGVASATILGSAPDQIIAAAMADATTTGWNWSAVVPTDWTSGNISARPYWVPGSTDAVAHSVRWSYDAKIISGGSSVTAAGTTTAVTGTSGARTANNLVTGEAMTDLGVAPSGANQMLMLNIRRVGANAADTYVGTVNVVAVVLQYTANQ